MIVVGLAEIGDKTQLLSLMLAARFLRPVPIIFGISLATIAYHSAAGLVGTFFGDVLSGPHMRWILRLSFLGVALWALFPDKHEGSDRAISRSGRSPRRSVLLFIAEIEDKTQRAEHVIPQRRRPPPAGAPFET
jgi:putative Ca2+/H+ antiporter (TMEM165/GDT1 family)